MPSRSLSSRFARQVLAHPFLEWGAAVGLVAAGPAVPVGWRTAVCALLAGVSLGRSLMADGKAGRSLVPSAPPARVEAEPASGARAVVRMDRPAKSERRPRGSAAAPPPAAQAATRASPRSEPPRSRGRVLFAGAAEGLEAVADDLRRSGCVVSFCDSVQSPLARGERPEPFDVVVFSPAAGDEEVSAAARELRERDFIGGLVRVAQAASPHATGEFSAAGGDDYIDLSGEVSAVARAIRRRLRLARELIENADTQHGRLILPESVEPLRSEFADDADIADLIGEFVSQLEARAVAISQATAKGDMQVLRRTVLQLKGAAGGYGFPSISNQARQVEELLDRAAGESELAREVDALFSLCIRASLPRSKRENAA